MFPIHFLEVNLFVSAVVGVIWLGIWKSGRGAGSGEGGASGYFLAGRGLTWRLVPASGVSVASDSGDGALLLDATSGALAVEAELGYATLSHRATFQFQAALRHGSSSATISLSSLSGEPLFELKLDGSTRRLYHVEASGDEAFEDYGGVPNVELPLQGSSTFDADEMATITVYLGKSGYLVHLETPETSGGWTSEIIPYLNTGSTIDALSLSVASSGGIWLNDISLVQRDNVLAAPVELIAGDVGGVLVVDWENRSPDVKVFVVERALSSVGPFREINRTDRNYYIDTDLPDATRYYYRVRVLDRAGRTSPWSSVAAGNLQAGSANPEVNEFSNTIATDGNYLWSTAGNWNEGSPDYDDMIRLGWGDIGRITTHVPVVEAAVLRRGASLELVDGGALVVDEGAQQYWNSGSFTLAPHISSASTATVLSLEGAELITDELILQLWNSYEGSGTLMVEEDSVLTVLGDMRAVQQGVDSDGYLELKVRGSGGQIYVGGDFDVDTENFGLVFEPSEIGEITTVVVQGDVTLDGTLVIDEGQISLLGESPDAITLIEYIDGTITAPEEYLSSASLGTLYELKLIGKQLLLEKAD